MKKIILLTFFLISISCFSTKAQSLKRDDRAVIKLQAVFIYNFTLYINWPPAYKKGDFIVGILIDPNNKERSEAFYQEFLTMAKNKKAGLQPFKIKKFNTVDEISKCHIVYIPTGVSDKLSEVIKKLNTKKYKTLIITDKVGLAQKGSAINFVTKSSRQKFELNERNTKKYDLKIASKFKQLAIMVP